MTGPSTRVLVLVWLGGLLAATAVGLLAVRLVAAQVGEPAVAPLSAVAAASAAPSGSATAPPATSPTATATSSPAVAPAPQTFTTAAGTLGVQCVGTALRLVYATPAQGWALDERSVSGSEAEVRFEGAGTRVRVHLSCASGTPRLVEQRTDPDGGGSGGGSGDDGGGDDD